MQCLCHPFTTERCQPYPNHSYRVRDVVWSVQPTDLYDRKISEGEARMEIFDRTFVCVGPSCCGPELRNFRSCTEPQDCDLADAELDRLPRIKVYEVLHTDLNVELNIIAICPYSTARMIEREIFASGTRKLKHEQCVALFAKLVDLAPQSSLNHCFIEELANRRHELDQCVCDAKFWLFLKSS
jgi:hypothetical protein